MRMKQLEEKMVDLVQKLKSVSESRSVRSDSLWPHGL